MKIKKTNSLLRTIYNKVYFDTSIIKEAWKDIISFKQKKKEYHRNKLMYFDGFNNSRYYHPI